ncbi:hypothetical protein STVA_51440 [Allostella vacuolata]|nr:hypothetical protein STVA_51440 [Stella vacuolata]
MSHSTRPSPDGGHWILIHNPTAGWRRARRVARLLDDLAAAGRGVTVMRTARRGDAESFARAAAADHRTEALIVAGGDGTINEAVNGMGDAGMALGLVPIGTANVLANELGIGSSMRAAALTLAAGNARAIRLGMVNGRRFAMMAGVGFDAQVVAGIDPALKRRLGKGAYLVSGLRAFWSYRPRRYRVEVDGAEYEAASAVCCNGRFYGGRFVLAEAARLDDDQLHVVLFERCGRLAILRYVIAMALGMIGRLGDVRVVPGRRISIAAVDGSAEPVQADGDIVAYLPAQVTMAEADTRVFAP